MWKNKQKKKEPDGSKQEQRKENQPINNILGKIIEDFAPIR